MIRAEDKLTETQCLRIEISLKTYKDTPLKRIPETNTLVKQLHNQIYEDCKKENPPTSKCDSDNTYRAAKNLAEA